MQTPNTKAETPIESVIKIATGKIATLQDMIKTLHKFDAELTETAPVEQRNGDEGVAATPARRKGTPRGTAKQAAARKAVRPGGYYAAKMTPARVIPAPANPPGSSPLDKPTTLGGAMKALIHNQTQFTGEALRNLLLADADFAKIMEAGSASGFGFNLKYWSERGYLSATKGTALEATYTVKNKEWFA